MTTNAFLRENPTSITLGESASNNSKSFDVFESGVTNVENIFTQGASRIKQIGKMRGVSKVMKSYCVSLVKSNANNVLPRKPQSRLK